MSDLYDENGNLIQQDNNTDEPENSGSQENDNQQNGYQYQNSYQQNGYQYGNSYYTPQPPKKKKNGKIAVIVTACVLLTVLLFGTVIAGSVAYIKNYTENYVGDNTSATVTDGSADSSVNSGSAVKLPTSADTDPTVTLSVGSSTEKYTLSEVAAMTVNSVVEIRTESTVTGNYMQQYITEGAGSGVIVTTDGYIATNNHVIDGASSIKVILRDGTEYSATLVGTDEKTDIAVVKIDATGLSPVTFADSDNIVLAETAIAIGNPLGELGGSVTEGIISALSRTITVENQEMTLLQTTAAVNPGNSGGGLFNMSGELIGVVNAKSTGENIEGIGFAIPSNTAISAIKDIIQYGYVKGRVMLGITTVEILDSATAMQYRVNKLGVYVYKVATNSDADKAGLTSGDLIVSFNGTAIESSSQLSALVQNCSIGDTVQMVIYRDRSEQTVTITFTEYNPNNVVFE